MRAMAAAVVVLWVLAGCGGDDDGPRSDAASQAGDDGAVPGDDAASGDGDGGGPCLESADCGGAVCCDQGEGGACVPSFEDCAGLVLCGEPDDCPEVNPVCCPQGFCGGCD